MPDFAVELREVTKRFPGPDGKEIVAVRDVSLGISDGEFFSLLGPSGCGKTTSLRMIAGFEQPSAGEVFIRGRAIGQTPPFKRPVNTVFQSYALFPHMTVGQNVGFGLEMAGAPRREIEGRVEEALQMVRLPGMQKRRPKQLSGGQQQRVALARALINRPEVLLLDEPLGALDLKLRKEMQLELKRLQREVGITFVYVTHDQEEALTMSDRIAVMNRGEALQVGQPAEIYERPTSRFVADFIGETNFIPGRVTGVRADRAMVEFAPGRVVRAGSARDFAVGEAVTIAVRPEKIHLHAQPPQALREGANLFEGRVEEVVYIGTDTNYQVEIGAGTSVRVREQNVEAGSRPVAGPGESVWVSWSPEAARVLGE